MPRLIPLCFIALLIGLNGCRSVPTVARIPLTGDIVKDGQAHIQAGPVQDRVLWHYRVGAASLRRGQFDEARRQFDDGLMRAGGILAAAGDASAARSRRLFRHESDKPFVGEPYERIMAGFYRGLLYWKDGEPDNARALFRNGQFTDGDVEDQTYGGDYVLLDYLDGLATRKLGGDGSDALARARANSSHELPDYDADANVLVAVEYGRGPRKVAAGEFGELLTFRTQPSRVANAELIVDGRRIPLPPYDDLNFQATTRGGRVMDHILGNKAVFKRNTGAAGDVALGAALVLANSDDRRREPPPRTKEEFEEQRKRQREREQAAVSLALMGIFAKAASIATVATADTRAWDNLPQYLSAAALRLPPGAHDAELRFQDASGATLESRTQRFTIHVPPAPVAASEQAQDVVIFRSELTD